MASRAFNAYVDKLGYYAEMPAAADSWLCLLLQSVGLQTDDALADHLTLAALLGAGNREANFASATPLRKTVSAVGPTGVNRVVDNTLNRTSIFVPDQVWTAAGSSTGGQNNQVQKALWCYVPTTGAADTAILPLVMTEVLATTDGNAMRLRYTNDAGTPIALIYTDSVQAT